MGLCHSASCGSRSYEFEYYNEAYRHQIRHRARAKLVGESLAAAGDDSATKMMMSKSQSPLRHPKQKRTKRRAASSAAARNRHPTQLWMCDQGCCSIRWKLDYAEFQSYTIYAQVSPYVVVQDKTGKCVCVICKGLPDKTTSSPSSSPNSSNAGLAFAAKEGNDLEKTPAIIHKACESQRLQANTLQQMLPAAATATETATPLGSSLSSSSLSLSLLPSEGSITDDDDDDGSI